MGDQEVGLALLQSRPGAGEEHQPRVRHRGGAEDVHHRRRARAPAANLRQERDILTRRDGGKTAGEVS